MDSQTSFNDRVPFQQLNVLIAKWKILSDRYFRHSMRAIGLSQTAPDRFNFTLDHFRTFLVYF